MVQGIGTVIYRVSDLGARKWYAAAFEQEPYFDQPFYVGFNVGGYELGATLVSAVQDVGEGIKVAEVSDPFGNRIGLIENPHFTLPAQ